MASDLSSLIDRLERVTSRLEKAGKGLFTEEAAAGGSATASTSAAAETVAPSVQAYDDYLEASLAPFLDLSNKIGSDVAELAQLVSQAFKAQREFIRIASKATKPSDADFQILLKPTADAMDKITDFRNKKRGNLFNHLSAVSEGIRALGWVCVPKTPAPFVNEMVGAGEFYSNKVLVEYKTKDQLHVDWVKGFKALLVDLAAYIKEHHLTGVSWNAKGQDWKAVQAGAAAAPAAAKPAGAGPPPPPAGGPPAPLPAGSAPSKAGAGIGDVFAQINSGNVTGGLRKVTKDMKNKYNPPTSSVVPASAAKPAASEAKPTGTRAGPPKLELVDGKKWVVEYQNGNHNIVIDDTSFSQTVYIYQCNDSVISVKGKVNTLTIDGCKKVGLVFESAVASCEIVNTTRTKVQCTGKVPNVAIDNSSGIEVYLAAATAHETDIVTSKSCEMNVLVTDEDGEVNEMPIPEQYITKYNPTAKKLVTVTSSHV